jgi:hypothetical protein
VWIGVTGLLVWAGLARFGAQESRAEMPLTGG